MVGEGGREGERKEGGKRKYVPAHHLMLREQLLDLADGRPGAARNARHALGLVYEHLAVGLELLLVHAVADVNHALELEAAFFVVHAAHHVGEARDHARHLGQRAHLHDVGELVAQVFDREFALGDVLHRVLLVELQRLHVLDEAADVAHAEELGDEGLRAEALEVQHVLACAEEDDGRVGCGDGGDGASARGGTVRLGEDNGSKVSGLLERAGLRFCGLADGGVQDHDRLVGLHRLLDLHHLVEEVLLLPVPTRRIHNDDLEALLLELVHALLRHRHGVRLRVASKVGDLGARRVLLELVEGTGAEGVGAHEAGLEAARRVPPRELGARGGFAGTLQADEHDDVGLALARLEGLGVRVDELDELVVDGFLDEALLVDARGEVLEVDGALDRVAEVHDELDVDVGFDEGVGDLLDHGIEGLGKSVSHGAGSGGAGGGECAPSRRGWATS